MASRSQNTPDEKAKLHYVQRNDEDGMPDPPKSDDEVHAFVQGGNYKPGDVINFLEDRFCFAYMVTMRENTGRFSLVRNPDDSGSGYLTVPQEVLKYSGGDGIGKYADIMEEIGCESVIFHFPSSDKFVTDKLGTDIPDGWAFQAEFIEGELECFWARAPGAADFKEFPYPNLTMEALLEAFRYEQAPHVTFKITVRLSGDKLGEYQAKYGQQGDKYAWLTAKPSLPASWTLEKGRSSAGSGHHTWVWILKGPRADEDDIKQLLGQFLLGFDFDIETSE